MDENESFDGTSKKYDKWDDEDNTALINIWKDEGIQNSLDDKKTRKDHVYKLISKRLSDIGINKSATKIATQIKNLKTKFKKVKDKSLKSGSSKIKWQYYHDINEILGQRPICKPQGVIDSFVKRDKNEETTEDSCSDDVSENIDKESDTEVVVSNAPNTSAKASSLKVTAKVNSCKASFENCISSKRDTRHKKSKTELFLENTMTKFVEFQRSSQQQFLDFEEKKMKFEAELENRRRQSEQAHELEVLKLLMQLPAGNPTHSTHQHTGVSMYPTFNHTSCNPFQGYQAPKASGTFQNFVSPISTYGAPFHMNADAYASTSTPQDTDIINADNAHVYHNLD